MKEKVTKAFASITGLSIVGLILIMFAASCSKTTNPNAAFIGIYFGNETAGPNSYADTLTITAGSTSSAVILLAKTSLGSSYTINGTVSGTTLTLPYQTFNYYSMVDTLTTGTGALTGSNLTINYTIKTPTNSINWNYTGIKQ
jgi:hypothetical protein